MAEAITLTTQGTLLNWLKEVGDSVSAGDIVAEIEADKATVEIEAPADGVLTEQKAAVGDELAEGDVIGTIGSADEAPADDSGEDEDKEAETESEADEAEADKEKKKKDKKSAEKKEEKPADGKQEADAEADEAEAEKAEEGGQAARTEDGRIKASPVARNIAAERGIELEQVRGTGPGGRITKSDVLEFEPGKEKPKKQAEPAKAGAAPAGADTGISSQPTYGKLPEGDHVEIIDMTRMRQRIAQGTIQSKQQIPHFYVTVEADVAPLLQLRKEINASLEEEGIRVSVNDMMVKAVAVTLRKFPNLNTHYYGDKLVRYKNINIGIAVALPEGGLLNVVARDADLTPLSMLAQQNKAMFERARDGRVKPDDLKGATFTISNLGPYGVSHFAAIISPPEAAILAVSSAQKVPVVLEDGTLGVGQRMAMTISVDHRVSDGAEGADFLQALRALLENPRRMLV